MPESTHTTNVELHPQTVHHADRGRHKIPLAGVEILEDIVHYAVTLALLIVAGFVLYQTVQSLTESHVTFGVRIIDSVNDALFVIIIMELMRTVIAHFEHASFQLEPFLIIGIISGVRHLLSTGARLTLEGEGTAEAFRHSMIELGVNSGVVLALAIALLLVRRSSRDAAPLEA